MTEPAPPKPKYPRPNRGVNVNPARITELRTLKLWTQAQLAERVGVTTNTVNKWESGTRPNSPALAAKLAKALGVKLSDLLVK